MHVTVTVPVDEYADSAPGVGDLTPAGRHESDRPEDGCFPRAVWSDEERTRRDLDMERVLESKPADAEVDHRVKRVMRP
jgi:hypothetical protein